MTCGTAGLHWFVPSDPLDWIHIGSILDPSPGGFADRQCAIDLHIYEVIGVVEKNG